MEATALETLCRWMGGSLRQGEGDTTVSTICTDSRALKAGDLFLALTGENFDGHSFLAEAAKRGAVGAVVSQDVSDLPPGFAVIRVSDTLSALQDAAAAYRRTLPIQV